MGSVNLTVRMDPLLKQQAERLFADIGMSMSTAVTVFAKAAVRQGRIPFELAGDPFDSPANLARLARARAQIEAGLGAPHELLEPAE